MVDADALTIARLITPRGGLLGPEAVDAPPSEGYGATAVAGFVPSARPTRSHPGCPPPALEHSLVAYLLRRLLSASLGCLRGGGDEWFRGDEPPLVGWRENLRHTPALGRVIGTIAADGRSPSMSSWLAWP